MSATDELIAFVRALDGSRLPDEIPRQTVRVVLDLVGVAIAGAGTPMGRVERPFRA